MANTHSARYTVPTSTLLTELLLYRVYKEEPGSKIYKKKTKRAINFNSIYQSFGLYKRYVKTLYKSMTTHLLSTERADWLKLHGMFNARDANNWQR